MLKLLRKDIQDGLFSKSISSGSYYAPGFVQEDIDFLLQGYPFTVQENFIPVRVHGVRGFENLLAVDTTASGLYPFTGTSPGTEAAMR